ncbi:MAG: YifB family Mg chelatase-like AAA ATPase [Myxococcota bacterium]
MATTVQGAGLEGIDGVLVDVQVASLDGLPCLEISGLPTACIKEAKHRIRSAFRSACYEWPTKRLVANLAPADLPKSGTGYDLPLAVAVMTHAGQLPPAASSGALFYAELGLDGGLRALPGAINVALAARDAGITLMYTALECAAEAAAVPGITVFGVDGFVSLVRHLHGELPLTPAEPAPYVPQPSSATDLSLVRGQLRARRALEVAAAGGHNLLLMGPPGCGKTLLARALAGVLPSLSLEERIDVTRCHSVAGLTRRAGALMVERPFRAPHATSTYAALIGGGNPIRPGEVALAHRGVLFLDETPEFSRQALEALRAPLEDRHVVVSRAGRTARFPTSVSLVCAMNPCPCGYRDDPRRACRCTPRQIDGYRRRLSGPLLDRVDIQVRLDAVRGDELVAPALGESTECVRTRVEACRARQRARNGAQTNAEVGLARLEKIAPLGTSEASHLGAAIRALGLTARSWHRVIRVARTIADLDARERIERADLSEALTYRVLEERRLQGGATVKRKQTEVSGAMVAPETPREPLRQEVAQCRRVE